jgi:hypothetical protein
MYDLYNWNVRKVVPRALRRLRWPELSSWEYYRVSLPEQLPARSGPCTCRNRLVMAPLSVPPVARFLFIVIVVGGGFCGFLGTWIVPVLVALLHGGFGDIGRLGVSEAIFPGNPTFLGLTPHQADWFKFACILTGGVVFLVAIIFGSRYWRRLVVAQGWMTEEDAKAFVERDDS